jgi:6-phosphogluconolactonase
MAEENKGKIRLHAGAEVLSRAAAGVFAQIARKCITPKGGRFVVALSGGHTPLRAYQLLSQPPYRDLVRWDKTHVFWGDERCVPKEDPRNNARAAMQALLDHVPVPRGHIHPIPTELPPEKAAEAYERLLREFFRDGPPHFDLIFLGLGEDGHTASLFPNTTILEERTRWVKEVFPKEQDIPRVSLTVPVLVEASSVVFLVQGAEKSRAVKEVLEGEYRPNEFPAQLIRPTRGELIWLVDEKAAQELQSQVSP